MEMGGIERSHILLREHRLLGEVIPGAWEVGGRGGGGSHWRGRREASLEEIRRYRPWEAGG